VHFNVTGIRAHLGQLLACVRDNPGAIATISEPKCADRDFYEELRRMTGWTLVAVARHPRDDGRAVPASGGVAVINTAPATLAMTVVSTDDRGMLAVEVRPRDGAWLPIVIVTAYIPPAGSAYAADVEPLYAALQKATADALRVYGHGRMLVSGDFNVRIGFGPLRGRGMAGTFHHSTDATRNAGADHPFWELLATNQLLPVAGRSAEAPARSTSRAVNGGGGRSCVDHWLLGRACNNATALPPEPWAHFPTSCTHRPAVIHLTPAPNPHRVRAGGGAPAPAPPVLPRWARHPYNVKPPWHALSKELTAALSARAVEAAAHGAAAAAQPPPSALAAAERGWRSLDKALHDAMDKALPGPRSHRPDAPPAGAPGAVSARAAQNRARAARGARALRLPPEILALLARARAARAAARRHGGPEEREAVRALQRQVAHALRAHLRATRTAYVADMHHLRVADPQLFFRHVAALGPPQANVVDQTVNPHFIPDAPGQLPAMERLTAAFGKGHSGPGPLPPAARPGGEFWHGFIKKAPPEAAELLARDISTDEIMAVLFPPRARSGPMDCPASGRHDTGCHSCTDFNERMGGWVYGSLEFDAPRHSPTANTSAAAPPDEVGLRELRFARPENAAQLWPFRRSIAAAIAEALSAALAAGEVPPDLLRFSVSSILKAARPGAPPPDAADPGFRRFIVLGPTLLKLLELVFAARFTHFGARHELIDPAVQGAFLPLADAGAHLFALLELLRARARRGLSTFALFCDVEDAYGSVPVEALCGNLTTVGFPPRLVGLIRSWGLNRTATVRVNGGTSQPMPVQRGLAAGACHSPALWNIYISSLARYLASFGAGVRVEEGGAAFSVFLFADDIVAPADSFEALQQLVLRVEAWCTAWGLKLKVAPTKTAFLVAHSPAARARGEHLLAQPPLLLASGAAVPHVSSYPYLGYQLRDTLGREGLAALIVHRLEGLLHRHFAFNGVISRAAAVTTRQVYKTMCVGSIGYLLALFPLSAEAIELLDAALRRAARRFLRLPAGTPSLNLAALAGLPSGLFLVAAARAGRYMALTAPAYANTPAARMARATFCDGPTARPSAGGVPPSWFAETKHFFNTYLHLALPWPRAAARSATPRLAAAYARAACALDARRRAPEDAPAGMAHASYAPTDATPRLAAAALALRYEYPVRLLGALRQAPLSYGGPGGVAPLAATTVPVGGCGVAGLASARFGAVALSHRPLAPAAWLIPEGAPHDAYSAAARGHDCPLCATGAKATPFHVVCACPFAPLAALRAAVDAEARVFLRSLADTVAHAARRNDARGDVAAAAHGARAALAAGGSAPLGVFALFHTVMVAPWHEGAVDNPAAAAREAAFGRLFDAAVVPNAELHAIFNSWVPWGARRLERLVGLWRAEVDARAAAAAAAPRA